MFIWRGLAISLACMMVVLMKLPARTMHSFAGGGDRVKPIGAANSDKGAHEFKSSKHPDYKNPRRRKLTEDAGLSLSEGIRQGIMFLLEEVICLMMAFILLIGSFLLISED